VGMSSGLCVAILGVGVEAFMEIIKELCETKINDETNPFFNMDKEREQHQNKVAHCVGGTAFNIGAAAMTGFMPGCWTKPRWGSMMVVDTSLTVASMYTGMSSVLGLVLLLLLIAN